MAKLLNQQLLYGLALGFPVIIGRCQARCRGPPAVWKEGPQESGTKPPQGGTALELSPDSDDIPALLLWPGSWTRSGGCCDLFQHFIPGRELLFVYRRGHEAEQGGLTSGCVCFLTVPEPSASPWGLSMSPERSSHISRGRCVPGMAMAPAGGTGMLQQHQSSSGMWGWGKPWRGEIKLWESP